MEKAEEDLAFMELYRLRDLNNKLFVEAWKRLHELDPECWKRYQLGIRKNDRAITRLMGNLCK